MFQPTYLLILPTPCILLFALLYLSRDRRYVRDNLLLNILRILLEALLMPVLFFYVGICGSRYGGIGYNAIDVVTEIPDDHKKVDSYVSSSGFCDDDPVDTEDEEERLSRDRLKRLVSFGFDS